jgi:hypothetical protein
MNLTLGRKNKRWVCGCVCVNRSLKALMALVGRMIPRDLSYAKHSLATLMPRIPYIPLCKS